MVVKLNFSLLMKDKEKDLGINPPFAVAGGVIEVFVTDFDPTYGRDSLEIEGQKAVLTAASGKKLMAVLPDVSEGICSVERSRQDIKTPIGDIIAGRIIAKDMHNVANPAIDPSDGAVIVTRSGSRGQQLPNTLYRIEKDGYIDELPVSVMNPTGIAFSPEGKMFVSNRAAGEIYIIERGEEAHFFAGGLGIVTGIAFDAEGFLFAGDRTGRIYRIDEFGSAETFAVIEPSVAAYHLAFGPDGRLYMTAPGMTSSDAVWAIDSEGRVETYFRGFGRPQGLAFDHRGRLYVVASYGGHRGIFRLVEGGEPEWFVSGQDIVGLCFGPNAELVVSTRDTVFSLPVGRS
ncbi:MAG: gluconolaconase [Acidobacteria bacterium]|nr:gluconolaconase [Acidobacteriota bacterium]